MGSPNSLYDVSVETLRQFQSVLGFDERMIREVINSPKHAEIMRRAVTSGVLFDERFELVDTLRIVVPEDYDSSKCFASIILKYPRAFYYYHNAISDKNYAKATVKLNPGEKIKVGVYQIKKMATFEDCMAKLCLERAMFVGAQGLALIWEQKRDELPKGRFHILSFDEEKALWKDSSGAYQLPYINRGSDNAFKFSLDSSEHALSAGHYFLCFQGDSE